MHQMLQPQGAINRILMNWGWIDNPMPFFTDATWARVTVIVINLWVGIPYTIMQVTGILQNILPTSTRPPRSTARTGGRSSRRSRCRTSSSC